MVVWGYRLIREAGLAQGLESQLADELDVQRQSWAKVWEEGKVQSVVTDARAHYLKLCAEGKVDSKQGHIFVEQFRWAAWAYPETKSLGCDGWRAHELASLPDHALQCFVGCLNGFVDAGCFPGKLGLNLMSMLPKPVGVLGVLLKLPCGVCCLPLSGVQLSSNGNLTC